MKVLDEGLDIPATSTAYLLASSAVRREWVQRRGRVLRKAPGKSLARLHDFFVVPPSLAERGGRSILRSELARADEFCRLAENAWDNDGPRAVTERYS
jgi:superfamily II DNA or RNA helicase